jgi:hypothetical protein
MGIVKFPKGAAAALASLTAGPIFITALPVADLYLRLPAPIVIDGSDILTLVQLVPLVALIGALIAFVPNMLGTLIMAQWSRRSWLARTPPAWIVVGGASGGGLGYLSTGDWPDHVLTAAFILTGGLCAALCRLFVDLGPPEKT